MTLFRPILDPIIKTYCHEMCSLYHCKERTEEEVLQYARVLCARGMEADDIASAVAKYVRIRSVYEREDFSKSCYV